MKKQIYAVRELNILTSDEEAKTNYLQLVRVNKITQSFDRSHRLSPFCLIYIQESHKALTQCHNGFLIYFHFTWATHFELCLLLGNAFFN